MFPFVNFFTYALVSAITPGPNTLMALENGRRKGVRRGITLNLGMLCGLSIVMTGCLVFSATLAREFPLFLPIMKVVGAAYMLYLACKLLRRTGNVESRDPGSGGFIAGLAVQFINPKIYIYGVTAISNYILPYFSSPAIRWAMSLTLALIAFCSGVIWLAGGAVLSKLFSRYEKPANAILSTLLIYCAFKIAIA